MRSASEETARTSASSSLRAGSLASFQGTVDEPPVAEALAWLRQFYGREQALFRHWLPPRWHQRFLPWLAQQEPPLPA